MHYKQTGMLPAADTKQDFSAQTQDAFSSNMRNDDFDEEGGPGGRTEGYQYQNSQPSFDGPYRPVGQSDHDEMAQMRAEETMSPLNHGGLGMQYDTSYDGAQGTSYGGLGRTATGRN